MGKLGMKRLVWLPLCAALAGAAWGSPSRRAVAAEAARYGVRRVANPRYAANELFVSHEDLRSKRFDELRKRYKVDKAVAGETDEWKRILLLRHWINSQMPVGDPTVGGDAFRLLDYARGGGKSQCGQHMVVQNAVMNAYGYVTRCLGAGAGLTKEDRGGHHGVNEIWSNTHCKWVLSDAKYDIHFEKNGAPLSALEVRDELLRDRGKSVKIVQGPERKVYEGTGIEARVGTYRWISWEIQGNRHSGWGQFFSSALVVLEDDYFRKHTWYRDHRPHWAYRAGYFVKTRHRGWIEWTPNVLSVRARRNAKGIGVSISSCTPNLKEYQMRESAGGEWRRVERSFTIARDALTQARHEWRLRSVNMAGVAGPEHRLVIERQ